MKIKSCAFILSFILAVSTALAGPRDAQWKKVEEAAVVSNMKKTNALTYASLLKYYRAEADMTQEQLSKRGSKRRTPRRGVCTPADRTFHPLAFFARATPRTVHRKSFSRQDREARQGKEGTVDTEI